MPITIDHMVTEIVPRQESASESSEGTGDKRWQQQEQLQAQLKQIDRAERRVSAEGFDD